MAKLKAHVQFSLLFYFVAQFRNTMSANPQPEAIVLYPLGHSAVEDIEEDALKLISSHAADPPSPRGYATLVEFYSPWCSHCQRYAPKYESVAEHFAGNPKIRITAFNCVKFDAECSQRAVNSFPSLRVFHLPGVDGSFGPVGHTLNPGEPGDVIKWVERNLEPSAEAAAAAPEKPAGGADPLHLGDAHAPLRPSVLMKHKGARWTEWAAGHRSERLGDAAASVLFGFQYGVFVDAGSTLSNPQREALLELLG